jgi:hypothetical protein
LRCFVRGGCARHLLFFLCARLKGRFASLALRRSISFAGVNSTYPGPLLADVAGRRRYSHYCARDFEATCRQDEPDLPWGSPLPAISRRGSHGIPTVRKRWTYMRLDTSNQASDGEAPNPQPNLTTAFRREGSALDQSHPTSAQFPRL